MEGCGIVYEITPSDGGWMERIIHAFEVNDGDYPTTGVVIGTSGELYGTNPEVYLPGLCRDYVYQLRPSGSGWSEQILHIFAYDFSEGCQSGGLILDEAGKFYGMTLFGGPVGGGTVFELGLSGMGWRLNTIHNLGNTTNFPPGELARDAAGNLYGVVPGTDISHMGSVFKLSSSPPGWTYTDLHDFNGLDGSYPTGAVALDAQGNLYGTTYLGGPQNAGVVWQITP
jgi:uncharacterized repeat protein (TIGR03803 family)